MKKHIKVLLATALIGVSTQMLAQETETKTSTTVTTSTTVDNAVAKDNNNSANDGDFPTFYIGFRFMPTFTSLDYRPVDGSTAEASGVISYGFGGFFGFNFTDHVALQPEVIYLPLAQKYKIADKVNNVKLDYINIPVLLRLNTGYSKPVNFNVVFGPQIGFNVGSSVETEGGNGTTTVNSKIAVKSGDFGFAYGAGLDFSLGGFTKLGIGFRGVYGLVDISDNSNTQETEDYYVFEKANVETYSGYIGICFGF